MVVYQVKNYLQQTKGDDCVPPPLPKSDGLLELKINWVGASAKALDDIAETSYFLTEKQQDATHQTSPTILVHRENTSSAMKGLVT